MTRTSGATRKRDSGGSRLFELRREGGILFCTSAPMRHSIAVGRKLVDRVAQAHGEKPARAIVIDARAIHGSMTMTQRFLLGVHAASSRLNVPVALVASADLLDPERFGILVARSRGLDARAFTDYEEAVTWIRSRLES